MIRIAIVEDEKEYSDCFLSYIGQYAKEKSETITAKVFCDGGSFLDEYKGEFDIILMDIAMPYMNGLDVAKRLRGIDQKVCLIFITTLAKYAIAGYEVNALDFLVKPVAYELFKIKLEKVVCRLQQTREDMFWIKNAVGTLKVSISDIVYVESQGHYLMFHLKNAETPISMRGRLKDLSDGFEKKHFCLIGRSILVNLAYVDALNGTDVVLNGESLPLSKVYRTEFMKVLTVYMGG